MYLLGKEINPEKSEVLWSKPFTPEVLESDFEACSGEWRAGDGRLYGENRVNGGGMLYSIDSFPGDIMLDFMGRMLPPCDHDLNFVLCTEGYDYSAQDAGRGYIGGISGWYERKAGFEKYPLCLPCAMAPSPAAQPGRDYHIQAGVVDGHCFMFVDRELVIEMFDPSPRDFAQFGRFGFGVFASSVCVWNLKVLRPHWQPRRQSYV